MGNDDDLMQDNRIKIHIVPNPGHLGQGQGEEDFQVSPVKQKRILYYSIFTAKILLNDLSPKSMD